MMNIKIVNSRNGIEQSFINNQFVLEENQEYLVMHAGGEFIKDDFKSIGTYISPNIGSLLSTNKIGVYSLKDVLVRFRSKLGDDFFSNLKNEIAEIEKQLLLSPNSIKVHFGLTYGVQLDEIALSLLSEAWATGKVKRSLRMIFEKPNFGFTNKAITKNLSHGDILSENDFHYLNRGISQLTNKNGKILPLNFSTTFREKTNDIIEFRFIKLFLFYCSNLLERNISSFSTSLSELKQRIQNLAATQEEGYLFKITEVNIIVEKLKIKRKVVFDIQIALKKYLRSDLLKNVVFNGNIDFSSIKLHNNFYYKYLLELFLKMRKTFDVFNNPNLVYLDINSLDNLYEYYCFIKIIKSFEIKPEEIRKIINKTSSGWVINKFKPIELGIYEEKKLKVFFKRNFARSTDTFSQDYEPDYTVEIQDKAGKVSFLHMDAKYKHNNYNVKKEDIDKMHTYVHAIKSTKASFVLFPGKISISYNCINSTVGAIPCAPWAEASIKVEILKQLNLN